MKKITIIPLLLIVAALYSFMSQQTGWKEISISEYDNIIKKASSFFEGDKKAYSVDVTISSFKTHTDVTPVETQTGYVINSSKYYHHFMMGIHSFQNKNYFFMVDSSDKHIYIANPSGSIEEKMGLDMYKKFKTHITKTQFISLKESDRVKVSFSEKTKISHIEMEFDKEGLLRKSVSYFRIKLAEDATDPKSKKTSPRIETIYKNYKDNIKPEYNKEFSETPYFSIVNGKFVATKAYSDYYIKDTRLKTK